MKVSLSWLNDYVDVQMALDDLVDALTMVGLEVDSVIDRYAFTEKVLVGRVLEVQPHPNADRLSLCSVDLGGRTVSVVCGAPNVQPGLLVPVAEPGTVFPDGTVLNKSVIRGVASEGMICSEVELALGEDYSGIMVLSADAAVGKPLNRVLGLMDPTIDIDLTPNRPDCLSIVGIAREIAAIQGTALKYPDYRYTDKGSQIHDVASVTIEAPDLCPRYAARLIKDIKVGPSPFWLQDRLMSVGLRPINNIVDITNYVMLETGQPLHAFDFDQLAGHKIIVRCAAEGEKFITLDEKERTLSADTLMICDGERPVAIGGVMGGLNSEIEESTTRVLIEGAYFNPISIRKTAKKLGLGTDASHRFERGVDPQGTVKAINRAAELMRDLGGGVPIEGLIDEHPQPVPQRTVKLAVSSTNRLLGTGFDSDRIASMLESIEFTVAAKDQDVLTVEVPSFRVDVSRPEDLMEEVARISGYNKIPTTFPVMPSEARRPLEARQLRNRIKITMGGFGFTEAINYSFIHKDSARRLQLPDSDRRHDTVAILNPLTEDQTVMRTSMIPGLLETVQRNLARGQKNLRLFEIGKIYFATGIEQLPEEIEMLAGVWTGLRQHSSWLEKDTPCDFFDVKGVLEGLLAHLEVKEARFTQLPDAKCHYTRAGHTAQIRIGDRSIGLAGEVQPQVLEKYDIKQTVFLFELNLNQLAPLVPETITSHPIPRFPAVPRDITLIVDQSVEAGSILDAVTEKGEELVEAVALFDAFEGGPIPAGKKSISFRITYRSQQRTLKDQEINTLHKKLTDGLVTKFKALLPE